MSWVRIDDSAMDHPKILQLTDGQFRLWVKGLCYCQKHLTDGLIPDQALKPMLGRAADVKQLCDVRLWDVTEGGFQVHDFLDWNDSRDRVKDRIAAAGLEKDAHRLRMKGWREAKKTKRDTMCDMSRDASVTRHTEGHGDVTVTVLTKPNQTLVQKDPTVSALSGVTQSAPRMSGTTDPEIARRAGDFFRQWEDLFSEHRLGATYFGNSQVDYSNCCRLVEKFDNVRLSQLAIVFLNSNEPFIEGSTRSLPVFAARISWCDEQLRKAEAKHQRSA